MNLWYYNIELTLQSREILIYMKWKVLFSVGNKTYKSKQSIFDNLEKALNYSPSGMEPAPPADQYNQFGANEQEEEMAGANGNSVARAKAKVSKYLRG